MKAKELMIGDWFHFKYPNGIMQIKSFKDFIGIEEDEDNVEPIPLTEDILKANGFKVKDDNVNDYILMLPSNCLFRNYIEVFKMVDGRLCVMALFHINEFKANRVKVEVSHVHELQHALRLCGLVELADNFKVE